MLCDSRSLKQALAWKTWNSSLPWTGFQKDITSIYCSNLRYFTTSGKMDAKEMKLGSLIVSLELLPMASAPARMLPLMGCGAGWGVPHVCFRLRNFNHLKTIFSVFSG